MPTYQIDSSNTLFDTNDYNDWSSGSTILGSNGNDLIFARNPLTDRITNISIYGSNGNDTIFLDNSDSFVTSGNGDDYILVDASNTFAFGDNGDDTLESTGGLRNVLSGGNGDDLLISNGGGSGMGPGNTLTGGPGHDTFRLVSGSGNLIVQGDAGSDGIVSQGDVFVGPMDIITDYQRGEHISLRNYEAPADSPAPNRLQDVSLVPDPLSNTGDIFRPIVGGDEYAVFHGTFGGSNSFTVDAGGSDLFVEYDLMPGDTDPVGRGSFVLLGVTDEQLVADAFSPTTASGQSDAWVSAEQSGVGLPSGADQGNDGYSAGVSTAHDSTSILPTVDVRMA